jgi:hypothetical protein
MRACRVVHRRRIAQRLMVAIDPLAREQGMTVLVREAVTRSPAARPCTNEPADGAPGDVPKDALMPDADVWPTSFCYKHL